MDAKKTDLPKILMADPRVAREDDDLLDWLRIMSNERFRRLPVVDSEGRMQAIFTRGDFVSYKWPDLIYQAKEISKATLSRDFNYYIIGAAILIYTRAMVLILQISEGGSFHFLAPEGCAVSLRAIRRDDLSTSVRPESGKHRSGRLVTSSCLGKSG